MSDERVSQGEKLSYASMNFGQSLLTMVVATYIMYFYTDVLLLPAAVVSVLLLLVRVYDGAIDPVIGFYMDKRSGARGKYIGYFRCWAFPFCVLTLLLFTPAPAWLSRWQVGICFMTYTLWSTAYSILEAANSALCVSITADPEQRPVVNTYKVTASVLATLVVSYGTLIFVESLGQADEQKGYFLTVLLFAATGLVMISPGLWRVRERNVRATNRASGRECLQLLMSNKKLLFFLLMYFSHQIASGLKTQTVIYYFKYAYDRLDMVPMFFLLGRIGSLGAQPLIVLLVRRTKTIYLMIGAYVVAGAFMALIVFCRSSMWLLILLGAASSVASAFPANLTFTYLGEIADEMSRKDNNSFSAIVGSLINLSSQIGSAVAGSVVALVLHVSAYVPNAAQNDSSMFGMRICFIGFTALMYWGGGLFALLSYLSGKRQHGG